MKDPNLPVMKATNAEKLSFYALFKQATVGENKTPQPSRLNMVASAKWNAWKALGSMTKDEAKLQFVNELKKKSSLFKPKL